MDTTAGTTSTLRQVQGLHWFTTRPAEIAALGQGPAQLLGLLRAHAHRTGKAWPAWATMARELTVSRATIHRWLRALRRAGLVTVTRTGRASVYELAGAPAMRLQRSHYETSEAPAIEEVVKAHEQVVVPATETTTPITCEEATADSPVAQPPDLPELRQELATARECAMAWAAADREAPEAAQARDRVACLREELAHIDDVQRAQEAVRQIPDIERRGGSRVVTQGHLWRLRRAYRDMAGDEWRRSILRWCAWHRRHGRRRIGDLDGWLARERYEPLPPLPECPDLPPLPPVIDAAIEAETMEPGILWRCAMPSSPACSFWREWTPTDASPPSCPHCGGVGIDPEASS